MKAPSADLVRHRLAPCTEVSELLSAAFERKLSAREHFRVWTHVRFCAGCRRFCRQLRFIARAMADARREARLMAASRVPPLSYSAREKIKAAISSYPG